MKVFVTGSSGIIGFAVVKAAICGDFTSRFHDITKSGDWSATSVIGTLHDTALLTEYARQCDAVIHTARDTSIDPAESIQLEINTIRSFGRALASSASDKIFLMASSFIGMDLPQGTEFDETCRVDLPPDSLPSRSLAEVICLGLEGIRPVAVRIPMQAHDHSDLHYFIKLLVQYSKAKGYVPYFEDRGQIKPWPCTHVSDLANAMILSMEKARKGGMVIHPVAERVPAKAIVEIVSQKIGLHVKAVTTLEVQESEWPRLVSILGANVEPSSEWTRQELGWTPEGEKYLDELGSAEELFATV